MANIYYIFELHRDEFVRVLIFLSSGRHDNKLSGSTKRLSNLCLPINVVPQEHILSSHSVSRARRPPYPLQPSYYLAKILWAFVPALSVSLSCKVIARIQLVPQFLDKTCFPHFYCRIDYYNIIDQIVRLKNKK